MVAMPVDSSMSVAIDKSNLDLGASLEIGMNAYKLTLMSVRARAAVVAVA